MNKFELLDNALKAGTVKVTLRRKSGGWVAVAENGLEIGPWLPQKKRDLQKRLSHRYLADVYDDVAFICPRRALKNPWWPKPLDCLFEIARQTVTAGQFAKAKGGEE